MKYFKLSEFDSPDIKGSAENMQKDFLEKIDLARSYANIPFKINSGFRTVARNQRAGGSVNSSHLKGVACDIHCTDSKSRLIMVNALLNAGFRRIGIANTFIHADLDKQKPHAIWLY